MAQLVVAAAGAAIGFVVGGPTGAQIGFVAGSLIGSAFAPTQKSAGPRLDDLKVSTSSYGTPIPYIAGHPRVSGQIVWASTKREIATTEEAGKGGGGSEFTTFTYEVDLLYLLSDNEIPGVRRVWNNGELAFDGETVKDALWTRMTAYTGASDQLPDPDYEAVVGTANAPAYRGRGSVFIKSLQLGGSGQIPNLTFEIGTAEIIDILFDAPLTIDINDTVDPVVTSIVYYSASRPTFSEDGARFSVSSTLDNSIQYDSGQHGKLDDVTAVGKQGIWELSATITFVSSGSTTLSNVIGFFAFGSGQQVVFSYRNNNGGIRRLWCSIYIDSWDHLDVGIEPPNGEYKIIYDMTGDSSTWNIKWVVNDTVLRTVVTTSMFSRYIQMGPVTDSTVSYDFIKYKDVKVIGPQTSYSSISTDTVQNVVSDLMARTNLIAGQFDNSALSTITRPVRAMAISQVSSARIVLEMLASSYHFDAVLSDKLYFRPRASASVATLTFDEFGVAVDSNNTADPLPLMMANELEIPAQMAITFSNVDGDYQTDTQYSDRLLTGQESTSATALPLGFTASEGKQIADALLLDKAVSALTTNVSLNITRAELEPTDVVVLTGDDGSTYRMRVVKKTEASGVITLGCAADDASVFTQAGVTVGDTASQTTVAATPTTDFVLLDIPLLRDVDNSPGFYLAVEGSAANWRSCAIYASIDDLTYSLVTTMADQTSIGTCTTTLGDWTGGNVFDETNTVTVNVGSIQQLASATRDAILTNQSTNAALVGSELIQYRTATLVSAGVYTLSGLLRGRRGTEWASTGHAASELFVALGTAGMRYLALQSGDLGRASYYKVMSAGQRLSDVTAQTIIPVGASLECFSPVNARANRDTTDTVLTWTRRTRLSTRLTGALAINAPLGETAESYEVEVWDASYATLKRTIATSTPTASYTSAQQVTDFGSDQTVLYLKIYQLSATVGRGYPLTVSV